MKRIGVALTAIVLTVCAMAVQAQDPRITITADQDEVLVGQPYILRLEVLVPTFMPKAPVFPTFEMPGLIVRLPERSTSPISERIDGATWAGVQRTYRIYPMRAGTTEIPAQEISIVFKDTETNEDVPLTITVPAIRIIATVPDGARALDPLILTRNLEIEQMWQVAEGELAVGDAVVRQLEILVDGASALFVPPLLEKAAPQGTTQTEEDTASASFLPYPEDPKVTDAMERGVMSGTRTEVISYIAQSGGSAVFPDITLSWYNLDRNTVEDIVLEGRSISVAIPPRVRTVADRQQARRAAFLLVFLLGIGWAGYRWVWPFVRPRLEHVRSTYAASVQAAQRLAEQRAKKRDLCGLVRALDLRTARDHSPSPDLMAALQALTCAIYRDGKDPTQTTLDWQRLQRALRRDRPRLLGAKSDKIETGLAPLNPFS